MNMALLKHDAIRAQKLPLQDFCALLVRPCLTKPIHLGVQKHFLQLVQPVQCLLNVERSLETPCTML